MIHSLSLPPRLIGIAGHKGHGKNLLAAFICRHDKRFSVHAFADGLKTLCSNVFKLPLEAMHDPAAKECPFAVPIKIDQYLDGLRRGTALMLPELRLVATNLRELLQLVGTEYVRRAHPSFWVESAMQDATSDTVFADVRFPNEAEAIRLRGGTIVRVVRDGREESRDPHSSEKIDFPVDATFYCKSGDLHRMSDFAWATLHLAAGPR